MRNSQPPLQDEYVREHSWKDSTFFVVLRQFSRNKMAVCGLVIICLLVLMAILAPVLAPYDYRMIDPIHANQSPSAEHWFGTDNLGRDIFTRILYGARYSLSLGFLSSMLTAVLGITLGALAGFFGGKVENVILRLCDIVQSIPNMLLCICISQAFGQSFGVTCVALSISQIPNTCRLLRAQILSVREQEFVEAARMINCSKARTVVRHVLPNSITPIIVTFSTGIGMRILASSGLSFLGLGIQEPTPEWGAMISAGRTIFRYHPELVIFPGIFIALTVLSFNLVGDGLRDALDPKLRQ
ncbi:MAG: ABC transporter permease [Clostridia bacterium]|nr:ABC transporter permease [Clostridia bacterium]